MPGAKLDTRNVTISTVPAVMKFSFSWETEPMNSQANEKNSFRLGEVLQVK